MGSLLSDVCVEQKNGAMVPINDFQGAYVAETEHLVALTHTFLIQQAEVNQADFRSLMGYMPAINQDQDAAANTDQHPIENVSWHEAANYANHLSDVKGHGRCYDCSDSGTFVSCQPGEAYQGPRIYACPGYRLPTEAEWEYAYRAGTTTEFYNDFNLALPSDCGDTSKDVGIDAIGWYRFNAQVRPPTPQDPEPPCRHHPTRLKKPNAWGVYDLAGNVWEWCHDWLKEDLGPNKATDPAGELAGSHKVLRGGGHECPPAPLRAALRRKETPDHRCGAVGLRLVRTLKRGPP